MYENDDKLITRNESVLCKLLAIIYLSWLPFQYSLAFSTAELEEQLFCSKDEKNCFSLQDRMKHYHVPGVSIAIIEQGKIVWAKGFGVQDLQSKSLVTTKSIFQACSISKPVTAFALLELVQESKLNLDQNVNEIIKGWHIPSSPFLDKGAVTVRNLLNHTAGFATGRRPMMPLERHLPSTVQILNGQTPAISAPVILEFLPGSKWQYSGAGYSILQLILEEHYHQTFANLMQEHVLQPLKMENSSFVYPVPKDKIAIVAHGHTEKGLPMDYPWYNIADLAAGGLWTTPTDLAKFMIEIRNANQSKGKVLSTSMAKEMLTPYQENFGLGLKLGGNGKSKWFGHGGDNAGYKAVMVEFLEEGSGAVVMTNSDNGWDLCMEIIKHIGEIYQWPIPAPQSF